MTSAQIALPPLVRETLLAGFITHEADRLVESWQRAGHRDLTYPGDPLGRVLVWLWHAAPDRAVALLGDYLAEVRRCATLAGITPALTLDELLAGLRLALPPDEFTDTDYRALTGRARREIPARYNART